MFGSLLLLSSQNATAIATFNSNSALTLTIDSISNNTNPGNLENLLISGGYQFSFQDSEEFSSGAIQSSFNYSGSNIDTNASSLVGNSSLQQSFSAGGSASNGAFDSYYQAYGTLAFENTSLTDSYSIQATLNYDLSADASGDFVSNTVSLVTFDDFGSLTFDNFFEVTADTFSPGGDQLSDSMTYNFILNPLEANTLYSDVAITASLEATPVTAPLPAANWFMLTGLAFLWKRRNIKPADFQTRKSIH